MNDLSGVLAVNKESGMTSHDVVNKVRRLYSTKQVGHTGTLDPMATGLLAVMVGRAVKASEYITASEKGYRAVLRLGVTYDTGDITGKVLTESNEIPPYEKVEEAVNSMKGVRQQIPPMYSALKVNGKKLVDMARKGIEVDRSLRDIEIYSISCRKTDSITDYVLDVRCSKGTYIRTLCEDIGRILGCGGTMAALERTFTGGFCIEKSYTLGQLENMTEEQRADILMPVESLFEDCPQIVLDDFYAKLAHCGAEIYQKKIKTAYDAGQRIRLCDNSGFFALGEVMNFDEGSAIKPIKQFRLE